jgi:hypothetical protein
MATAPMLSLLMLPPRVDVLRDVLLTSHGDAAGRDRPRVGEIAV